MRVEETELPGVLVFTPRRFEDERGVFVETFSQRTLEAHAPGLRFVQDNQSRSTRAFTLRGLHYQAPPSAQAKLVRVVRGRIFDVAVDARRGSATYGRFAARELCSEVGAQMLVPEGFLHGFLTLEPETIVAYKVSDYYDPACDGAVRWNSPVLAIPWPAPADEIILSTKDAAAPDFADFASPF